MPDIFISYAREDAGIVRDIAGRLTAAGYKVWWDYELLAGDEFRQVIQQNLRAAKAVIVLWSKHSVLSRFVFDEADDALQDHKLIAIRMSDLGIRDIPLGFRGVHTLDIGDFARVTEKLERLGILTRSVVADSEKKQAGSSGTSSESQRRWWQPVIDMQFDDPNQERLTYRHQNYVRTSLPMPGTWLIGYRSKNPPQCGVYLRLGEIAQQSAINLLNPSIDKILEDLSDTTEFRPRLAQGIFIITTRLDPDFTSDDEKRNWLKMMLNRYVNILNPYFNGR